MHDSMRAQSPTPVRQRSSQLDLFNEALVYTMGFYCTDYWKNQTPKRLKSLEIDQNYKGEIPDTPDRDLPPEFNEAAERQTAKTILYCELMDHYLSFFYDEMNDKAAKLGLNASNFVVAHGMHHF